MKYTQMQLARVYSIATRDFLVISQSPVYPSHAQEVFYILFGFYSVTTSRDLGNVG